MRMFFKSDNIYYILYFNIYIVVVIIIIIAVSIIIIIIIIIIITRLRALLLVAPVYSVRADNNLLSKVSHSLAQWYLQLCFF